MSDILSTEEKKKKKKKKKKSKLHCKLSFMLASFSEFFLLKRFTNEYFESYICELKLEQLSNFINFNLPHFTLAIYLMYGMRGSYCSHLCAKVTQIWMRCRWLIWIGRLPQYIVLPLVPSSTAPSNTLVPYCPSTSPGRVSLFID